MHGQRQLIMVNVASLIYKGFRARKVHDLAVPSPVPTSNGAASVKRPPVKHKRVRLDSIDRIRFELAKIYREARDGERDTQDFSRLANGLSILGRLIEGGDLERRLEVLERITKR